MGRRRPSGITGHPAHSVVGSLFILPGGPPPLPLPPPFGFLSPVSIVSRSVSCLSLVFVLLSPILFTARPEPLAPACLDVLPSRASPTYLAARASSFFSICASTGGKRCGGCQLAVYCSKDCQVAGWPIHKFVCSKKVQVKPNDGHGFGLFAREAFEVGDEIIREPPILKVQNATPIMGFSCSFAEAQAHAEEKAARESCNQFERLTTAKQRVVMSLSDAHHAKPTAFGVLKTNCIPIGTSTPDSPSRESGIFPLACRLNHACAPNARYVWRADLDKLGISVRDAPHRCWGRDHGAV